MTCETWVSTEPTHKDLVQKRGDSASIVFTHTFGASGNIDEARFYVRTTLDGDLVMAFTLTADASHWDFSTSNVGVIDLLPADTYDLVAGVYYYDIELVHTDGTVKTFQDGRYALSADISNDITANGGSSNPAYVGEVRMIAGSSIPTGWLACDGTVLNIVSHQALFDAIGDAFGGDGVTTFALPDLRGRGPLGSGTGSGLTARTLGQTGGGETVTLTTNEMPSHRHVLRGTTDLGLESDLTDTVFAQEAAGATAVYKNTAPNTSFRSDVMDLAGTGAAFNKMSPFLVLTFIIAYAGYTP